MVAFLQWPVEYVSCRQPAHTESQNREDEEECERNFSDPYSPILWPIHAINQHRQSPYRRCVILGSQGRCVQDGQGKGRAQLCLPAMGWPSQATLLLHSKEQTIPPSSLEMTNQAM